MEAFLGCKSTVTSGEIALQWRISVHSLLHSPEKQLSLSFYFQYNYIGSRNEDCS